jgi:lysozyme family protein
MCLSVFDTSVLCGPTIAPIWVQENLNVLNNGATLWPDIEEDGWIFTETVSVMNKCAKLREFSFVSLIASDRISYAKHNARLNKKLEKYMNGWIIRAESNRQG